MKEEWVNIGDDRYSSTYLREHNHHSSEYFTYFQCSPRGVHRVASKIRYVDSNNFQRQLVCPKLFPANTRSSMIPGKGIVKREEDSNLLYNVPGKPLSPPPSIP